MKVPSALDAVGVEPGVDPAQPAERIDSGVEGFLTRRAGSMDRYAQDVLR